MSEQAKIVLSAEDRTSSAFKSAQKNLQGLQKELKLTAQQNQQLAFQLNDFFVQVASGQGVLMPLIQQGSQLSGTFGGIGGALKAVTSLLTPMRLAVGGAAAAVGILALAYKAAADESKAFNDAIVLSGNFAGQTQGSFDQQNKAISSGSRGALTNSATHDAGQALIATGQVGPSVFKTATEAAARYAKATGQTAAEVAKDFAGMSQDALKWATEHNQALNFITLAQRNQIKTLQDSGREVEAQQVVYELLNQRLRGLDSNLGTLDRTLGLLSTAWDTFWTSAKGVGKAESAQEALDRLNAKVATLKAPSPREAEAQATLEGATGPAFVGPNAGRRKSTTDAQLPQAEADQLDASRRLLRQLDAAYAEFDRKNDQKRAVNAAPIVEGLNAAAKAGSALELELKRINTAYDDVGRVLPAGGELSNANERNRQLAIAKARRDFGQTPSQGSQISLFEKELDASTRKIAQSLSNEQDLLKFNQQFIDALYRDGNVSLEASFKAQDELRRRNLAEIEIAADKEVAAQKKFQARLASLPAPKDASEAAQRETAVEGSKTKINDAEAKRAAGRREAQQAADLAAATQPKQTERQQQKVADFNASVEDLINGGRDRAAERSGNVARVRDAKDLLTNGGATDTDAAKRAQDFGALLEKQRQFNIARDDFSRITAAAATAEETLVLAASQGGAGLLETEGKVRDLRKQQLDQLAEVITRTQAVAEGSKDPAVIQSLNEMVLAYERLKAASDPTKLRLDAAAEDAAGALTSGLRDAVLEGGKLRDIIKDIDKRLAGIVLDEVAFKPFQQQVGSIIKGSGGQGAGVNLLSFLTGSKTSKPADIPASDVNVTGASQSQVRAVDNEGLAKLQQSAEASAGATDTAGNALTKLAGDTSATSTILSILPTVGATPATQSLAQLTFAANSAATALLQIGGSVAASSGGSSGGGLVNTLTSIATSHFGGGGGVGGDTSGYNYAGDTSGSLFSQTGDAIRGRRAEGGPVDAGGLYLVGEKGPELVLFDRPGHVLSHHESKDALAGKGKRAAEVLANMGDAILPKAEEKARRALVKYHSGGIAGSAPNKSPDDVLAILQAGEEVISKSDPRHRDSKRALPEAMHKATGAAQRLAGVVKPLPAPVDGLARDEVPAVLRRGDEVITAEDPRHSGAAGKALSVVANMRDAILPRDVVTSERHIERVRESLKSEERLAVLLAGEEVLTEDDPRHRGNSGRETLGALPKYHAGGIVGDEPDSPLSRMADRATSGAERATERQGKAGDTYHISVSVPPGTPRETANQIANRIAERASAGRARNG